MLRKAAETDLHAAGFGMKIEGLRPSDTSQGFFDTLDSPLCVAERGISIARFNKKHRWTSRLQNPPGSELLGMG